MAADHSISSQCEQKANARRLTPGHGVFNAFLIAGIALVGWSGPVNSLTGKIGAWPVQAAAQAPAAPASGQTAAPISDQLQITTTYCPGGKQLTPYAGCTITAKGGTPPYKFSVSDSPKASSLPEGMSLNPATGAITAAIIGGQGWYTSEIIVTDSTGVEAQGNVKFAIDGNNAFAAGIFPPDSIFHHRVDAATTSLPVDTSPAAPMFRAYLTQRLRPFFGSGPLRQWPTGIPMIEVPSNQPEAPVSTNKYQSYYKSAPIPDYAPVEGTSNVPADRHVLVYREKGKGGHPSLFELWGAVHENGQWRDGSNAFWPDADSDALTPQGKGTSDAAGLPIAPLVVNADEVIGTGTPSTPNGIIRHPIRFTLNHMMNYWVWPATETAGVGYCSDGINPIPVGREISQAHPPLTCTMSGPAGEIYRLKASVETPPCAATSPQAAIIITAFRNYGIILADNGMSGGIIGTPDARWNDADLSCMMKLTLGDFEPVNVSSLMVSDKSGQTK